MKKPGKGLLPIVVCGLLAAHSVTTLADDHENACMEGPMEVETRAPKALHRLMPGDRLTVPVKTAHEIRGVDGAGCKFLLVQAGGAHDFQTVGMPNG